MTKKINWAGLLLVIACVAGIWYISMTYEETITITGTVVCVDETSGALWVNGDDNVWYMPITPISGEYMNGTRVAVTAVVKKGDVATHREKYISVDLREITPV